MPDDISRLAALRQGITHSRDNGYVAIRVADLRWLLDQVDNRAPETPRLTFDEPEGDLDDPEHE